MALKKAIYAMIPARIGSSRLKMKNLALINGKPLIYYAIQAAKESDVFDKIIINSDHQIFSEIADRYNVDFYPRPKKLGSSKTKSDEVVSDFINNYKKANIVAWVNPIAPFQTGDEINKIINYFIDNKLDSLITVEEKKVHCIFDKTPVNYSSDGFFEKTQNLVPVKAFAYTLMIWRANAFKREYEKEKSALFCGEFDTFTVNSLTGMIIKTQHDLLLADLLMSGFNNYKDKYQVQYHPLSLEIK